MDLTKLLSNFPSLNQIWEYRSLDKSEKLSYLKSLKLSSQSHVEQIDIKKETKCNTSTKQPYLILENLFPDMSYSSYDTKLSLNNSNKSYNQLNENERRKLPKDSKILRSNGMIIKNKEGEIVYNSDKRLLFMSSTIEKRYLQTFFSDQKKVDVDSIQICINEMKELLTILKEYEILFDHSSVFVIYSKLHKHCIVKYLDFSYLPRKLKNLYNFDGLEETIKVLNEIANEHSVSK